MTIKMTMGLAALATACAVGCGANADPSAGGQTPEATGTATGAVEIGQTHDQCSTNVSVLNAANQSQGIPWDGAWHYVDVASRRFTWLCGGSTEFATCNVGTTYIYARHRIGEREIDWSCQQ